MNALYDERLHRMMKIIETKADKEALKKLEDWMRSEVKKIYSGIEKTSEEMGVRLATVEDGAKRMIGEVLST